MTPTYGNTLMGLAASPPSGPENGYKITYYATRSRGPSCRSWTPDDADSRGGVRRDGRVMLTTLTREFFVPRFQERDEGEREPPCDQYPWDGVSGGAPVQPLGVGDYGGGVLGVCAVERRRLRQGGADSWRVGRAAAPKARSARRRWRARVIHFPILRWGQEYKSLELAKVEHFLTGEPVAEVSQANPGIVARDLRKGANPGARRAPGDSVRGPAGDGQEGRRALQVGGSPAGRTACRHPDDFVRQQSATTGAARAPVPDEHGQARVRAGPPRRRPAVADPAARLRHSDPRLRGKRTG